MVNYRKRISEADLIRIIFKRPIQRDNNEVDD